MSVLVTGGAGYIGSHVVRLLQNRGESVVVVDDLSTGIEKRIGDAQLVKIDIATESATSALINTIRANNVTSVIHFAARKQVGESVADPEWYFQQNLGGFANLLTAMRETQVTRLVFSSSAATYGMPDVPAVDENIVCEPINPYGQTKLIGEWMLANAAAAWGLRGANLRYFYGSQRYSEEIDLDIVAGGRSQAIAGLLAFAPLRYPSPATSSVPRRKAGRSGS